MKKTKRKAKSRPKSRGSYQIVYQFPNMESALAALIAATRLGRKAKGGS